MLKITVLTDSAYNSLVKLNDAVVAARDVSGKKAKDTRTARICKMRVDGLRLIAER